MAVDSRRLFLASALGFLAAPAIVRASSLMPVKPIPSTAVTGLDLATREDMTVRGVHFNMPNGANYIIEATNDPLQGWVDVGRIEGGHGVVAVREKYVRWRLEGSEKAIMLPDGVESVRFRV